MEENTHEKLEDNSETYHLDLEYLRKKKYNKEELIELEKMCLIFIERDEDELEGLKGDVVMERAVERLELISQDEKLIGLYDADAVERKVWKTKLMYAEKLGTERGMKKGIEKGIQQGIDKGRTIEKEEIAKSLLANGVDINIIANSSSLTIDEINKLNDNL